MTLRDQIELILLRWRDDFYKRYTEKPNEDTQMAITEILDLCGELKSHEESKP